MPAPLVKSFADRGPKSRKEGERLWKKAKAVVRQQYGLEAPEKDAPKARKERYYSLVTGILKRMMKVA